MAGYKRVRLGFLLVVGVALTLALALPSAASAVSMLAITGTVVDASTDEPLEGYECELWDPSDWSYLGTTYTDVSGVYRFYDIPAGTYEVDVYNPATDSWPWELGEYDGVNPLVLDFQIVGLGGSDTYEPDDTIEDASHLTIDTEYEHTIAPEGDEDWFSFDVEAGKTYFLVTYDWSGSSDLDNYLELYDSDGMTVLAANDDYNDLFAGVRFTADETETLYALVRGLYFETVGSYGILYMEAVPGISGTVTRDENDEPLPDIEVTAYYYDDVDSEWYVYDSAYTDESGDFALYDVEPGDYRIGYSDPSQDDGYYEAEYYDDVASVWDADTITYSDSTITGIDAALALKTPAITGTVTADSNGLPLQGIWVSTYWFDGEWNRAEHAETDENGEYAIYDLWDDDFAVGFEDEYAEDGYYAPEFYDDVASIDLATGVAVTEGVTTAGIDAALAEGAPSITGNVTAEDSGDPLCCIDVALYYYNPGDPGWYVWEWAWTDEGGDYAFYGLGDGPDIILGGTGAAGDWINPAPAWRIGFADSDPSDGYYAREYYDDCASVFDADNIYTTQGVTTTGIDAVLSPGAPDITGTVYGEDTGDPLSDIDVYAYYYDEWDDAWYETGYAYTDWDGTYAFYGLADGGGVGSVPSGGGSINFVGEIYRIGFEDNWTEDGYYLAEYYDDAADVESADDVIVPEGSTIEGIDATLTAGVSSMTGTVTDEDWGDPLSDISVVAYEYDGDDQAWLDSAWEYTDGDGEYAFYGLGDATVKVGFHDYYSEDGWYESEFWEEAADLDSATEIAVTAGGTVAGIDGTLVMGEPEIVGEITDASTGDWIDGASVYLWWNDGMDWWVIDGVSTYDGYYEFYGLDADDYKISARAKGYQENTTGVFAHDGSEMLEKNLALTPQAADLSGHVRNINTSAAISGAYVEIYRWNGEWSFWDYAETGSDGKYAFWDLEPGSYKILAFADGYIQWESGTLTFSGAPLAQNALLVPDYTPADTNDPVYGRTRYATAVEIAQKGFDPDSDASWPGVTDIVLSSGEDRASADPLSASGLCWAYDAPLFLTSSARVSDEVKAAVKQITAANGIVTVHIVGGTTSVPDARFTELNAYTGGKLKKDRVLAKGSRYDLAAAIAYRMVNVSGEYPETVLVANGADATKFFDALALSPISAQNGFPILLVSANDVPVATEKALDRLWPDRVIVGGGPNTVSKSVVQYLGAERWYGSSRYTTAITIANKAIAEEWLSDRAVGVAAKLPDALSGGSFVGRMNGVLLLTRGDTLTPETGAWIKAHQGNIEHCFTFGGPNSITSAVRTAINNALK